MNAMMSRGADRLLWVTVATFALIAAAPVSAADNVGDLEQLLQDVGKNYARGYLAPLVSGFGADQNSALIHTARIPGTQLSVGFGIKMMAAGLDQSDKTFQTTFTATLDERYGLNAGDPGYGDQGVIVMNGPTVFGDPDRMGSITAYYHGLPVKTIEGIEGLVDSDWVPLALPQATVGGIMGLQATVRWLPDIDAGDIGKIKLWGIGLAASANYWLPTLTFDVSAGFFRQSLDVGEYVATDASTLYIAASKEFAPVTVYALMAHESSSMDVDYDFTYYDNGTPATEHVAFSMDGVQNGRFTIGATLDVGLKLNAEVGIGDLTTYGAGLVYEF